MLRDIEMEKIILLALQKNHEGMRKEAKFYNLFE